MRPQNSKTSADQDRVQSAFSDKALVEKVMDKHAELMALEAVKLQELKIEADKYFLKLKKLFLAAINTVDEEVM